MTARTQPGDQVLSAGPWGTLVLRNDTAGTLDVIPAPDVQSARAEGFMDAKAAAIAELQKIEPVGLPGKMVLTAAISKVDKIEPKPKRTYRCTFGHGEFEHYAIDGRTLWGCRICGDFGQPVGVAS